MQRGLILVSYYARTLDETCQLLDAFDIDTTLRHDRVIVVDNRQVLESNTATKRRTLELVRGSNSGWEFSGWLEGLDQAFNWENISTITLLNDSYQRNWGVTAASQQILKSMYQAADQGFIAGWLDNFSWLRPPRFSRRTNSRLVVLPFKELSLFSVSLQSTIRNCSAIVERGGSLFNADDAARVKEWLESQSGRWAPETLPTRLQRIYLEHHLFENVPAGKLAMFPRSYLSGVFYAIAKRWFSEAR